MKKTKIRFTVALTILTLLNAYANAEIFYPLSKLKATEKTNLQEEKTPPPIPQLKLSAVASSNGRKIALINGKYLKEGEKIYNCVVTKIRENPPSATLYCEGIKVELKIDLIKSEEAE